MYDREEGSCNHGVSSAFPTTKSQWLKRTWDLAKPSSYISQDQHSSGLPPKLHTVHGHWMSTTSWTILKVSNSGDTDIADHLVECLDNARLESEMGGNYEITKEWHTYRRHPLDEGIVKVTPISPEEVDAGELQNSCNPETWKRPKKASSYLPISVLSMCYKLLERIILYHIAPLASAIYGCVVCILMYRHSLRWSTYTAVHI